MHILFLSSWYPYPPDNGSKLRVYHLLKGLAQEHEVTLLTFAERPGTAAPQPLKALCREIHSLPRRPFNPTSVRALAGLISLTPRSVLDTYQPQMAGMVHQLLQSNKIDLIIASQWWTAAYYRAFSGVPAIYEEVETGVLSTKVGRAASPGQRLRHLLPLFKLRGYLRRQLPRFQAVTVVSEVEKGLLQWLVPGFQNVRVIPNGIQTAGYRDVQAVPRPDTLIFSGSLSYSANLDGMQWFLAEVYPRIQAEIPAVKVIITGHSDNVSLPLAENVILTGFVEDVRPLIASACVSLAPIRLGGGTRLKILEAMALGTAVVSTTKGAEGINVRDGEHLLLADSPERFASAVVRLLQDREIRQKLTANSCRLVREQYDWAVIMPDFLRLVQEVSNVQ